MDYYEDRGDEIVVHLDYEEPEPSLYMSSRSHRPTLPREYAAIRKSSQGRKSRTKRGVPRLQEHSYEDDVGYDYVDYDQRDDATYGNTPSRTQMQDQRQMSMGSSKSSLVSSKRGSSKGSASGAKSKIDLTRPDSDSSFELFATLIVGHIAPKVKDGMYTLEKSDMSYFDAIIPHSLRRPFVEAVRVRNDRIGAMGTDSTSALDKMTKKCKEIGLGFDESNNFLLGGGKKLMGGKVQVKIANAAALSDGTNLRRDTKTAELSRPESRNIPTVESTIDVSSSSRANNSVSNPRTRHVSSTAQDDIQVDEAYNYQQMVDQSQEPKTKNDDHGDGMDWLARTGLAEEDMAVIRLAMASKDPKTKTHSISKDNKLSQTNEPSLSTKGGDDNNTTLKIPSGKKEKRARKDKNKRKKKSLISSAISVHSTHAGDGTVVAFVDEWRDGLWNIFGHGICHPAATISIFAPLFALGQVMTRLKLNWVGSPATPIETNEIYLKLGTLVVCWLSANILVAVSFQYKYTHGVLGTVELFLMVMINMFMYTFSVFATGNTRSHLRQVYHIQDAPGTDYLLAAVYMPLAIAQMLRHTADYNQLEAYVCTATGLFDGGDFPFIRPVSSYVSYATGHFNDEASIVSSLA